MHTTVTNSKGDDLPFWKLWSDFVNACRVFLYDGKCDVKALWQFVP